MHLSALLSIVLAVFLSLGTLLLGMGERSAALPLLAVGVSAVSVLVNDLRGWLRLSVRQANWAGVLGIVVALWDLVRLGSERELLAVANLLVYLQFVLQFLPKRVRTIWQLLALNFLQVAVASALSFSLSFGIVMALYLAVGLAVLALFYLHRQRQAMVDRRAAGDELSAGALGFEVVATTEARALEQLARKRSFWSQVAQLGLGALIVTVILFIAVPRFGGTRWIPTGGEQVMVVGASDRVTLGEIGSVVESPQATMVVRLTDLKSANPYLLIDEPYLRGVTLTRYARGVWERGVGSRGNPHPMLPVEPPWTAELVKQEITIEPLSIETLFAVYPAHTTRYDRDLLWNPAGRCMQRAERQLENRFSYEIVTNGLRAGRQLTVAPALGDVAPFELAELSRPPAENVMPTLRALADELVAGIPASDRLARAVALTHHLRFSGKYRYSLDLTAKDEQADPIEDFVRNTREGHCEYFASALVMLLRSAGIPARMVVGFKGGDFNRFGGFYQVRQLHAHAWVEVYLPAEQLPDNLPPPASMWTQGGWLRLDPTPTAVVTVQAPTMRYTLSMLQQMSDFARYAWSSYVLGMDARRQQQAIYQPIQDGLREAFLAARRRETWTRLGTNLGRLLGSERFGWLGGEWFNWRAGVFASGLCAMLVALWRGTQWGLRVWRRFRRRTSSVQQPGAPVIPFYQALERLLREQTWQRALQETHREFAARVGHRLAVSPVTRDTAHLPQEITEAFYCVRFGGRALDSSQQARVEQSLHQLSASLAAARETAPSSASPGK